MTLAGPGHNSGVSTEQAMEEMRRSLEPWQERRAEFVRKADAAVVDCQDAAEAAVDFVRMARALRDRADNLLGEVREPYQRAAQAATGVANQFTSQLDDAIDKVQGKLRTYNEDRKAKAAAAEAQQREAEERLALQAAERDGLPPPPAPSAVPAGRRRRKAAPIHTDLGGRMVEQDRWRAKVVDATKVPAMVLNAPRVLEAIRIVAQDLMKNGITVEGVEKEEYTSTTIT